MGAIMDEQTIPCESPLVTARKFTCLLPLWRMAGWTLGFVPTFLGRGPWLYHTVEAVETFVEGHYLDQVKYIKENWNEVDKQWSVGSVQGSELIRCITWACEDEVEHRDDARRCLLEEGKRDASLVARAWKKIVDLGSQGAAGVAKYV